MAAELDITDGVASAAFFREPAWHKAGTVFQHEVTSSTEAGELAHLNGWNTRTVPIFCTVPLLTADGVDTITLDVPEGRAVIRDNPITGQPEVLGNTGRQFTVVQNEDLLAFLGLMVDGARWETVGALKGGRIVFGSLALERETIIDPNGVADVVKSYMLGWNGHDGSHRLSCGATSIRVVCNNTFTWAINRMPRTFTLRHTSGISTRLGTYVADAQRFLGLANDYLDAFEVEAQQLFATPFTTDQLDATYSALYEVPEPAAQQTAGGKAQLTRWSNRRDQVMQVWNDESNAGIKGSAWGGFNALQDVDQWQKRSSGKHATDNLVAGGMGIDAGVNAFRTKIHETVLAVAAS